MYEQMCVLDCIRMKYLMPRKRGKQAARIDG